MAIGNFANCLEVTLKHEGGYSDHPADPGGATNMGITHETLAWWRGRPVTKDDVRSLSRYEAAQIYQVKYWNAIKGDRLPAGVDLATFDFGVNSGTSRAAKYLQREVGVAQDGLIGPKTLEAVEVFAGVNLIQSLCARRLSFLQGLKTFSVFGRGWSKRVADVEAKAVAMWLATQAERPAEVAETLAEEAKVADQKATAQDAGAAGAAAGGGAAAIAAEPNWWLLLLIGFAVIGMIGLFIQSRRNRDRAEAYRVASADAAAAALAE